MNEQNSLNYLLGQVGDLLQKIQKRPVKDKIPPEALMELERLELAIDLFLELNQKSFQEANIDIEALRKHTAVSKSLTDKEKQILDRAKQIEKEARNIRLNLSPALQRGRQLTTPKDPKKQRVKERRKKFKPLGGDKGWIPL